MRLPVDPRSRYTGRWRRTDWPAGGPCVWTRVPAMNLRDYIGQRGENVFRALITKWCDAKPWFSEGFLGDKHEAKDLAASLIGSSLDACFHVQFKATLK